MKALNLKKQIPKHFKKERGMHSYAAKMVNHIPKYFLMKKPSDLIILDPFCGSGTVLKEASKKGMKSYGMDINPLARLISEVETTSLKKSTAIRNLKKIKENFKKVKPSKKNFLNIDYWFSKKIQEDLSKLKKSIDTSSRGKYRKFFYVCFSSIIRKASYADPRIAPPVKSKRMRKKIEKGYNVNVWNLFSKKVKTELKRKNKDFVKTEIIGNDARKINLSSNEIDLIITSPPYINAQKYFRSNQLELYWLDLVNNKELRKLDEKSIGTERVKAKDYNNFELTGFSPVDKIVKRYYKDKKTAYIILEYYKSMIEVIKELYRVLNKNGRLIFVIGDNNIKGKVVPSGEIFQKILTKNGFKLDKIYFDKIESYSLMTKRNKTADIIKKEWVIVAKK